MDLCISGPVQNWRVFHQSAEQILSTGKAVPLSTCVYDADKLLWLMRQT